MPLYAEIPVLKIACSSNFVTTLNKIITSYKKEHKVDFIVMQGSSGKLSSQIINGLPANIFLSADQAHAQYLIKHSIAHKKFIYAIGQVVLLTNSTHKYSSAKDYLLHANIDHLSMANPKLAPYGSHAKEFLKTRKLWDKFRSKIVYGENINQVFNYVIKGNVKAGFVALSQINQYEALYGKLKYPWKIYLLNSPMSYIDQYGVILNHSTNKNDAEDFINYLLNSKQSQIRLHNMGYKIS
ncbi:MAG: molybdate transport system substrate-binding protein [Francisellaceae bacterium]|jgi:molybdate transport system substrate-binding protein